jgi:hypothetical protein
MPWKESSVVDERLRFVAQLLDGEPMTEVCRAFGMKPRRPRHMRARGSAKTSAHQCSLVGSCEVDHGRVATTSRIRSIASIRIAISGRLGSSRVKFGTGLVLE